MDELVDLRPSRTEQDELDASELAPGATSLIIAVRSSRLAEGCERAIEALSFERPKLPATDLWWGRFRDAA
jgi:hypothetical protein